jgi:hypothetical protein
MQYGDRVRVRREPNIEFTINREQFGNFGREVSVNSFTGRTMPLTVWYEPDELEVIR